MSLMIPDEVKVGDSVEQILRQQHGDLQVLIERQSELNRRLGLMESRLERVILVEEDVAELKEAETASSATWTWLWQTPVSVLLTLVATWAAFKLGVPIVGP